MDFNKLDFDELAIRITDNASKHGWWETERDPREVLALIHSELSEALEEYRAGRDMVWYHNDKPEGIAVELIDAVIRILDLMGHYDFKFVYDQPAEEDPNAPLPIFIAGLHYDISSLMQTAIDGAGRFTDLAELEGTFSQVIRDISLWLENHGVDLCSVLDCKMMYNVTRPYKHGGKVC